METTDRNERIKRLSQELNLLLASASTPTPECARVDCPTHGTDARLIRVEVFAKSGRKIIDQQLCETHAARLDNLMSRPYIDRIERTPLS